MAINIRRDRDFSGGQWLGLCHPKPGKNVQSPESETKIRHVMEQL